MIGCREEELAEGDLGGCGGADRGDGLHLSRGTKRQERERHNEDVEEDGELALRHGCGPLRSRARELPSRMWRLADRVRTD